MPISSATSSSSSNRFSVLNGIFLDVDESEEAEGSMVDLKEVINRVRVEQVVDREIRDEKSNQSELLNASKTLFSEATTNEAEVKVHPMANQKVEESTEGESKMKDIENSPSGPYSSEKMDVTKAMVHAGGIGKEDGTDQAKVQTDFSERPIDQKRLGAKKVASSFGNVKEKVDFGFDPKKAMRGIEGKEEEEEEDYRLGAVSELSKLATKGNKRSPIGLTRPSTKQDASTMSKEELKEFNYLKGIEVKEKFMNDQVFRQKWMDREKTFASEMRAVAEVHEKSVKSGMLEEVVNTATTKKASQVRPPKLSTEQTEMEMSNHGKSSEAMSFLTFEEMSELKNIITQKTRDKFTLDAGFRRDWMERKTILDTTSSYGGPGFSDSDDEDDVDGFIDSYAYVNCDSETLSRALSLGKGRKRFSSRISKGGRRHWG